MYLFSGGIVDVSEASKKYYAESAHPIMVINHLISFYLESMLSLLLFALRSSEFVNSTY